MIFICFALFLCRFEINIDEVNEQLPDDRPVGFMFLSQQCLEKEADQRPTAQDVLETVEDSLRELAEDQLPSPPVKPLPPFV